MGEQVWWWYTGVAASDIDALCLCGGPAEETTAGCVVQLINARKRNTILPLRKPN